MPFPIVAVAVAALLASQPAPAWLKPVSRVRAEASIETPRKGAPSRALVVAVDVTPAPGIHVYAPGNEGYIAVDLSADAMAGITPGKAEYPRSEPFVFGELKEVVQVYAKPFRVRLPIALDGGAPRPASLGLTLRYQACTDKVCYPPATLPLEVAVPPAR
jgi:DsbC/DsbD-like thiol-disulfide interchange protein